MKQTPTIPALTGLRFFAAMSVVVSHAIPKIIKYDEPPAVVSLMSQTSAIGMTLFFVLSGFVIYLNYSQKIGTAAGLRDFFVARFARIYPLFFLCVAFDIAMKFAYFQLKTDQLPALVYYATMTQSWFYMIFGGSSLVYQFGLLTPVTWSISTEWFFYVVFPVIALALLNARRGQLITAAVVLCVATYAFVYALSLSGPSIIALAVTHFGPVAETGQDGIMRWLIYFSPYVRIFEFALGCIVAAFFVGLRSPSDREQRIGIWLTTAALLGAVMTHIFFFGISLPQPYQQWMNAFRLNFGYAPILAMLIFCCARYDNPASMFFSRPMIVLGGEISYSIYMLHLIVINAFRYEVAKISEWQIAIGSYLNLTLTLSAVVGLSLVSWRFIEVPARSFIRRAASSPVPLKPAFSSTP